MVGDERTPLPAALVDEEETALARDGIISEVRSSKAVVSGFRNASLAQWESAALT